MITDYGLRDYVITVTDYGLRWITVTVHFILNESLIGRNNSGHGVRRGDLRSAAASPFIRAI